MIEIEAQRFKEKQEMEEKETKLSELVYSTMALRDENTHACIERVFPYQKCTWVVWEELSTGLRRIINITNNFDEAYGSALRHIYCENSIAGDPFLTENKEGIGFMCCDSESFNSCTEPKDFVFVIGYREDKIFQN